MRPTGKKALRLLALALCCMMLFTACRPSTALARTSYDWDDWKITVQANMITSDEDADEETTIHWLEDQEKVEDSREDESDTAEAGDEDEEEDTADLTQDVIYDPDETETNSGAAQVNPENTVDTGDENTSSTTHAGNAEDSSAETSGGAVSETSGGGSGSGESSDGDSLELEENNGQAQDQNETITPTEENPTEENNNGGSENQNENQEIVDPNGELKTVVSGEGRVAAVGEAATLVCMLAGVERLCATSESQATGTLIQQAFPIDEEECEILWSGDGSSRLSDEDFATLLEIGPDAVFYLSGTNTFTSDQLAQLKEAEIEYYPLDFTSMDGVEEAVYNMGIALGDEAEDRADEYLDWCDALEKELSSVDAVDTVFIQDWDAAAVTTVTYNDEVVIDEQDGAAVIRVGTDWNRGFLEYAEEYAAITDRSKDPSGWSSNLADYCTADGSLCLISALRGGAYIEESLWGSYTVLTGFHASLSKYESSTVCAFTLLQGLGDVSFPGVIVSNESVKEQLLASELWDLDTYSTVYSMWFIPDYSNLTVPAISLISNPPTVYKFADYGYSYWYYCYGNILADYGVYVNPTGGIGSWMDGSAESVLEAVWAAAMLSGYDKESMYETIQDFYSTFYGLELTTSEIDDYVLAGA